MQKTNKSASASLGVAFIFLFLAAVPVSLRAVGINVSFSPRLGAVTDAWDQIAGVLTSGHQTDNQPEWAALNTPSCHEETDRSDDAAIEPALIARLNEIDIAELPAFASSDFETEALTGGQSPGDCALKRATSSAAVKPTRVRRKAPERRMKFNFQTVAAIKILKPALLDQKDLMKQVEREMRKHRLEYIKALRAAQIPDIPEIVIQLAPDVQPECGEKRAAPVRVEDRFLRRPVLKRPSAKTSIAPENSEI
ncbi:MAG: hypothetical protein L0229_05705 [Blastocatellia bacterium]|nr:hypothetical protein [Blastocatellia bacterium]